MDRREKTFTTIFGPLTLKRIYYHCAVCGHGWCPRDRTLDLAETSLSPAVTRMIGLAASAVSFEEASRLLLQLAGLGVDAHHASEGVGWQQIWPRAMRSISE